MRGGTGLYIFKINDITELTLNTYSEPHYFYSINTFIYGLESMVKCALGLLVM